MNVFVAFDGATVAGWQIFLATGGGNLERQSNITIYILILHDISPRESDFSGYLVSQH